MNEAAKIGIEQLQRMLVVVIISGAALSKYEPVKAYSHDSLCYFVSKFLENA